MSVETLFTDVELGLVRLLRLGLGFRYPTQSSLAHLSQLQVSVLPNGALCYVTGEGLYEWLATSTTTANGSSVVASSTLPANKTNGRWHLVQTDWTYGAGGLNLGAKTTGYLRSVEPWSSDDGVDAAIERVFGRTPSVLVQFTGDDPQSQDMMPGTFFRDTLSFQLLIVTANMRPSPTATQGSPFSTEAAADPGAYKIIGDLRRLLYGIAPFPGITGVERLEVGRVDLGFEDLDRRLFIWTMEVRARTSYSIDDEDLVDATVRAQPALTDQAPDASAFDADNYVSRGGGLDEGRGPGLARVIEETIAKVGGVAMSAAELEVTFSAESDTYRDLDADGWHLTVVAAGDSAPTLIAGRLRVGVTRTDNSGVVSDRALCSYSVPFGDPIDAP